MVLQSDSALGINPPQERRRYDQRRNEGAYETLRAAGDSGSSITAKRSRYGHYCTSIVAVRNVSGVELSSSLSGQIHAGLHAQTKNCGRRSRRIPPLDG